MCIRDRLNVAPERFGLATGVVVIAYMLGSMGVGRLAKFIDGSRILSAGGLICVLSAIALIVPVYAGIEDLYVLIGGLMLYAFGMGFLFATGPVCAMDAAGDGQRSSASALLGSCQMAAGALGGLFVGFFYDGSATPMVTVMGSFIAIGCVCYLTLGWIAKIKGQEANERTS